MTKHGLCAGPSTHRGLLALALLTPLAQLTLAACGGGGGQLTPGELVQDPAVATGCQSSPPAAGESRAKLISCTDELPSGHLVSGRQGDVLLENDRVKIVVRGFGEGYYLMGTAPGGIVDATRHGADDQIKEILPLFNFNGGSFDEIVITEAGDDGPATVVVRGPVAPIPFIEAGFSTQPVSAIAEQHYILAPDTDALLIRTFLFPIDGSEGNVELGDAMFLGGVIHSWGPGRGLLEGGSTVPFVASVGGRGTSYGLAYAPESAPAIKFADIANVKVSLGPTRTLGNDAAIERYLIIGDGSPASITSRGWALLGEATGTIRGTTAPGLDIAVTAAAGDGGEGGADITRARADASGGYEFTLPAGNYQLQAISAGHAPGIVVDATVAAGGEQTVNLIAGASGTLTVTVTDSLGSAIPARVVLRKDELRVHYAGANGQLVIPLAPGDYGVDVSRGMEYTAFTANTVTITDGAAVSLDASLERVVDTAGWIAVDTHLHSEMSTDSQIPLDVRLLAVAAEGIEVPISTDHDFVTDYGPIVADLGLGAFIAPIVGVETSSLVWGHVNAWGLTPDYDRAAGHAVPWFGISPGDVYELMRARGDQVTIQLNHPRSTSAGNFHTLDFNPSTVMADRDPEDLDLPSGTDLSDFDFDAFEVANDFNHDGFASSLIDWLALVASGHPVAATGSSDSHGRNTYVGNSRTYVYVGDGADDPRTIDPDLVSAALRARKAVVAQGAFIRASIIDPADNQPALPGEMIDLSSESEATLQIHVQAAPWMPLSRIVIYAGREIVRTVALDAGETAVVRYASTLTIPIGSADDFFVVLVEPAGAGAPVLGTPVGSFTNPLLFDANGDGVWTP